MWLWTCELKQLGFKRKSDRYFQCARGYGLNEGEFGKSEFCDGQYISLFLWTQNSRANATCFELSEFHITMQLGGHNIHFYFHEKMANVWEHGGHTSSAEIHLLGYDANELCRIATVIATNFIGSLQGEQTLV